MQLARVGNPFIDKDQTRPVFFEQFAQHVAGFVAFSSSARMRLKAFFASFTPPAAKPSCQASSPQNVRTTVPSAFVTGLPGDILFPRNNTFHLRQVRHLGFFQHGIDAKQFARFCAGK